MDTLIKLKILRQDGKIIDSYYYAKHYNDFIAYVKNNIGNNLNNYKVAIEISDIYLFENEEQLSVEKILNYDDVNNLDELVDMHVVIYVDDKYDKEIYNNIMEQFKERIRINLDVVNIHELSNNYRNINSLEDVQENEDTILEIKRAHPMISYSNSNKSF